MMYSIEGTQFMTWRDRMNPNDRTNYAVNFSGNPKRDNKFGSYARKASVIIPESIAEEIQAYGIWVGLTRPKEGEEEGFEPTYYTTVKLNYNPDFAPDDQPKVYLVVPGTEPLLLNEDTVGQIDALADSGKIESVDMDIRRSTNKKTNKSSLYIQTMYVVQKVDNRDSFFNKYHTTQADETAPF